jgi:hypothetical protein
MQIQPEWYFSLTLRGPQDSCEKADYCDLLTIRDKAQR